jgi:hypothetical protein
MWRAVAYLVNLLCLRNQFDNMSFDGGGGVKGGTLTDSGIVESCNVYFTSYATK